MDREPENEPIEEMYVSEPVAGGDDEYVVAQENAAGRDNMAGGGEWPDPDTPPAEGAPGAG